MTDDDIGGDSQLAIYEGAERNAEGDVVVTKEGRLGTHEVNISKLFRPGKRKTSNVQMLLIEARMLDQGRDVENPAFPMGDNTAEKALELMDSEGIEPAWLQGPTDWEP